MLDNDGLAVGIQFLNDALGLKNSRLCIGGIGRRGGRGLGAAIQGGEQGDEDGGLFPVKHKSRAFFHEMPPVASVGPQSRYYSRSLQVGKNIKFHGLNLRCCGTILIRSFNDHE
jgi:hypothetical protein